MLKAGDWIEVRSKQEILASFDFKGRLDGLPFMPEMFQHCGKRFRVYKRAHKTCDTVTGTGGRRLPEGIHLDLRCDDALHAQGHGADRRPSVDGGCHRSFLTNEGAALSGGEQLHRIARRMLGQRAYWSAVSSLVRGHGQFGMDLLRFAFAHCPSCALLPALGDLFRKKQALHRVAQVSAEAARRPVNEARQLR